MKNICIIPLRSKSKRIKDKNIKLLNNTPLCCYSILSSVRSNLFSKIVIATDSKKYCNIILQHLLSKRINTNNIFFFFRSKRSATDKAASEIILNEVLKNYNYSFDKCYLVQATSPFIKSNNLINADKLFLKKKLDSLFSSCYTKKFLWTKNKLDKLVSLNYDFKNRPMKQDFNYNYYENGAFYIFKVKKFIKSKNRLFGKIGTYVMDENSSLDIDDINDFKKAENFLL